MALHCSYNVTPFFSRFNYRRRVAAQAFTRFSHRFIAIMMPTGTFLGVMAVVSALTCIVAMFLLIGFDHRAADIRLLRNIIRIGQILMLANIVFNIAMSSVFRRKATWLQKIVNGIMLLTLIPLLFPYPQQSWFPSFVRILYSSKFIYTAIAAYSVVELSYAVMCLPRKRTNPSLILSSSFLLFIIIGSLILMLPKFTYNGISFVDSLFVSTSAVCITGLCPVDVPATFTPLGQLALAILMEIGALGVLTFTSFFAIFFTGNASIYSQLVIRDVVYSKSMSSLVPTLLYILGVTVVIQLFGAGLLFLSVPDSLGLSVNDKIVFSLFHSLSAFCNAGFSNLPDGLSNQALMNQPDQGVYWVVSLLVVAGAIGFPILVNFKDAIRCKLFNIRVWFKRRNSFSTYRKQVHLFDMNTKVVLFTFSLLFILGTLLFFVLEYDHTLEGMTMWQKISQSVFNSVTPRSSGFTSINPSRFLNSTLVMVIFLMWVGGAAQSTAGGVKVNTLATISLNLRSIVTGKPYVTAYHRRIAVTSIRRANAVVAISLLAFLLFSVVMLILVPYLPAKAVLFETCSALFTVGSSLGITSQLPVAAKLTLCVAMFLGRVGIISLLSGMTAVNPHQPNYPTGDIIIN